MTAPKLFALNRFYAPDHSATAQLLTELAEHLAAAGHEITVITSRLRYDDPEARLPARERIGGVEVRRVWTSRFGRHRLLGRAVDYATFYLAATVELLRLARPGDVVLVKTDPPLLSVPAALVAALRRCRLLIWCQDVFPEIAAAHGLRLARGLPGRILRWLRNRSFARAERIVAIHPRMAEKLAGLGVPRERIAVIENWAPAGVHPVPPERNPLRRAWGLEGRFVVGYSGNLGRAHDPEGVIELVRRTAGKGVTWLFVGGGAGMEKLRRVVEQERLADVHFHPYQPRERLAESLSLPDVHLVSLDPRFEGLLYPSKVYGIRAAGRPLLWLRPGLKVADLRAAARRAPKPADRRARLAAWAALLVGEAEPAAAPVTTLEVGVG